MGRDKALLPFRGAPLVESIARQVEAAAGSVVLVGGESRYGDLGRTVIPDLFPGEGPLGGILTALRHTSADWNLIVACDMPAVSAAFFRELFDAAEEFGADALLPAGPSGLPEPLCAIYHVRSRNLINAAFDNGVRKVTAALEGLRAAILPVAEMTPFQNVNTPEDWSPHASD
jgi:molybdenum cofactor guanylyltransferase